MEAENTVTLKEYLHENMIVVPKGTEIIRNFYDEHKWLSSNYKMSIPGKKSDLRESVQQVEIDQFQLLRYPVTLEPYNLVINQKSLHTQTRIPVVNISWIEAIDFCNTLSSSLGLMPYYIIDKETELIHCNKEANGFRLPTEAEWQHACHADSHKYQYGNIDDIAWHKDNSDNTIHCVGEKLPNDWGFYDMLGNVWEWCWDLYDEKHYGSYRVFRGGSWAENQRSCGATCRRKSFPTFKTDDLGFRIARNI